MAKKCRPQPKVRQAGRILSTSKSAREKFIAARKLTNHRWANH